MSEGRNPALSAPEARTVVREPADSASATMPTDAPAIVHATLRAPGRPLDARTRGFFEPRFGHDLSGVRVHTDDRAAQSAEMLDAKAYTVGRHIVFSRGSFDAAGGRGRRLLAHELAHSIQQRGPGGRIHAHAFGPVLTPARPMIARQPSEEPDIEAIEAQIMFLRQQLSMPVAPMRNVYLAQLQQLEARRQMALRSGARRAPERRRAAAARAQAELNEKAVQLAEKQARRREFWNSLGNYNPYFVENFLLESDDFRNKLAELDTYWDQDTKEFRRDPRVDALEAEVDRNPEALRLYRQVVWDRIHNKPAEKSWFDDVVGFVCQYTNPCHDNMKQFRADIDSGMSRDEALQRGLFRLGAFAIPSRGPRGPIAVGPKAPPVPVVPPVPVTTKRVGFLGRLYAAARITASDVLPGAEIGAGGAKPGPTPTLVAPSKPAAVAPKAEMPTATTVRPVSPAPAAPPTAGSRTTQPAAATTMTPATTTSVAQPSLPPATVAPGQGVVTQAPEVTAGFQQQHVAPLGRLLGKALTSAQISRLGQIWGNVANPGEAAGLTAANSRRLFNNQRGRFWRAVRQDPQAMQLFTDAGLTFGSNPTSAPYYQLPSGERVQVTVDHIVERQTDPSRALDPGNLRLSSRRENTVLLRLIHLLDPFQ